MINGHGDDAWRYKTPITADFSSNVWYGGLEPGLQAHLQKSITTITHYPQSDAQGVQEAAAKTFGVSAEQVLVTNGATEAIYLVAQTFRRLKATIITPTFAEYEDACRLHGLDIQLQPWDTINVGSRWHDGMVFLCNPNNPTGATLPAHQLQRLFNDNLNTLFVIDESYIGFTRAIQSLLPFLHDHPNVLILRSLTKSCSIPGLRIGFAVGHRGLISRLRAGKMPWSVNQLAIEAALYIFRNPQQFALPLPRLLDATAAWRNDLMVATNWRVHNTDTHYFLLETPSAFKAAALKQHLVNRYGLLIRDASNFSGLTPHHFRVACQSAQNNQLLTDALHECSQNGL
jgi:threonine-phosphate decarboxylase